jgi:sphingosine-1-phosphate phosphatase 1
MWETIHYLNDLYLVLKFQNYFGIHRVAPLQNGSSNNKVLQNGDISSNINKESSDVIKRKNIQQSVPDDDGISSESDTDSAEYIVKYKIWYYIFYLGTTLGDEVFYATFIPFWFWNIDGFVGESLRCGPWLCILVSYLD